MSRLSVQEAAALLAGRDNLLILTHRRPDGDTMGCAAGLCAALRQLHVPGILVTLLLLTYRYVSLMLRQVSIMTDAYALRAPGQKGVHISAWGSFLGQLLLRSIDRGSELYQSMELRGFCGEFHYADGAGYGAGDLAYTLCWTALFLAARLVNLPRLLGNLFV